jgi:hypothetical protein
LSAKKSCVQSSWSRFLPTSRPMKFRCFISSRSNFSAVLNAQPNETVSSKNQLSYLPIIRIGISDNSALTSCNELHDISELKNQLSKAWQSHAKRSGGYQTCHYRRQVLAIGANSIRGRLGHYRTGFRRPSQDRRHRLLRPASKNQ